MSVDPGQDQPYELFESYEQDTDDPASPGEPGERPGARRLLLVTIAGGALALCLSVLGGVWVIHDLDKSPSGRSQVIKKYENRLDSCIRSGKSAGTCSNTVIAQCIADPYWHNDAKAITTYCDLRSSAANGVD